MGRLLVAVAIAAALVGVFAVAGRARNSRSAATTHAPAACVDAISRARIVTGYTTKALTDVQPLFAMVPQAAKAGLTQNSTQIYAIAAKLKHITAQINAITAAVTPVVLRFNADAASCH